MKKIRLFILWYEIFILHLQRVTNNAAAKDTKKGRDQRMFH